MHQEAKELLLWRFPSCSASPRRCRRSWRVWFGSSELEAFIDPRTRLVMPAVKEHGASVGTGGGERACRLQKQGRDEGDRQRHAQEEESVAEAHDMRLLPHKLADGDDRLVPCSGRIGDAMAEKIARQFIDPVLNRRIVDADALHQDVGVKLLTLGLEGLQQRDPKGAAEVPHHVEERRGGAGIFLLYAGGGDG